MSHAYYCPSCGRLASEPCEACEKLRAEVADLKARLKAARAADRAWCSGCGDPSCHGCLLKRALDLRVKRWRK